MAIGIFSSGGLIQKNMLIYFNDIITPATIYIKVVIPAKAGIQNGTGCRIRSGMTIFDMFTCRSNK
jgi:hypothetical protein